ncbi:MAG: hypothetical protein ACJAT7_000708 [Psychromonas sp.]|jgi:hypothetical protein|uniref:hypothetical protein n=1 Tax=Psychromonas sp. TaxID=1884585 RepID=UPI0039E3CBAC
MLPGKTKEQSSIVVTEETKHNMVNVQEGYSEMFASDSKIEKGAVLIEPNKLNQTVEQLLLNNKKLIFRLTFRYEIKSLSGTIEMNFIL